MWRVGLDQTWKSTAQMPFVWMSRSQLLSTRGHPHLPTCPCASSSYITLPVQVRSRPFAPCSCPAVTHPTGGKRARPSLRCIFSIIQ